MSLAPVNLGALGVGLSRFPVILEMLGSLDAQAALGAQNLATERGLGGLEGSFGNLIDALSFGRGKDGEALFLVAT